LNRTKAEIKYKSNKNKIKDNKEKLEELLKPLIRKEEWENILKKLKKERHQANLSKIWDLIIYSKSRQ
jgi:hypothetical protein